MKFLIRTRSLLIFFSVLFILFGLAAAFSDFRVLMPFPNYQTAIVAFLLGTFFLIACLLVTYGTKGGKSK